MLHLVAQHRLRVRAFTAWRDWMSLRHLVDWVRHRILDRLDRAQISDHRIEIAVGHNLIEAAGHDHGDWYAVPLDALAQQLLELGVGVIADASFFVLRNVRCGDLERRLVPRRAAGKSLIHDVPRRTLRHMAVAAG